MSKKNSRRDFYAFTLFFDGDLDELKNDLANSTKQWIFQKELCPSTQREHYQGQIRLHEKKRITELQRVFTGPMLKARCSPTCNVEGSKFYCLKEDTRLEGPWSDGTSNMELRIEIPWDLAKITEWFPWQTDWFGRLNELNDRHINLLIDKKGGRGKSKAMKFALWKKWIGMIPCVGDAKDIIQACCSMGPRKTYVLDLPRQGESDKQLYSQIRAIEQVKNGVVVDFRYKYHELIFGSPNVWVFTNSEIDEWMLSEDRWHRWEITDLGELKRVF